MSAVSKKQRRAMAIAEHHPSKLHGKNKGLLKMTHGQLHDYAATKEKGLPSKRKGRRTKKSFYLRKSICSICHGAGIVTVIFKSDGRERRNNRPCPMCNQE